MRKRRTSHETAAHHGRTRSGRRAPGVSILLALLVASTAFAADRDPAKAPPLEDPVMVDARMAVRTKRFAEAVSLWREAASRGNVEAAYLIGIAHRSGRGVERDLEQARRWLFRASANGSPDARYALGMMYRSGLGVPRSRERAIELFERAAAAGHEEAKRELRSIARSGSVAFAVADARVVSNRRDPRAALTQSIRTADLGSAREALARGAPIDGAPGDTKHWRPLVLAIDRGNVEMVRLLLELGADPNVRSRAGEPALILAIRRGLREGVAALLRHGAAPATRSRSGYTALMVAAQVGDEASVRRLLASGAKAGFALEGGTSAASLARRFGHASLHRLLVRSGSPRQIETERTSRREALEGSGDVGSMPPVIEAARRGDAGLLQEMVDGRVDLRVRDGQGETALARASMGGHVEAIEVLLDAGVDPNEAGAEGVTPLMRAMESEASGSAAAFARLIAAGADVNARDERGRAAFDFAPSGATPAKLERIAAAGASWTRSSLRAALETAVVRGRREAVDALFSLTRESADRIPALCRAVEQDAVDLVTLLLERSTPPDGDCGGGATPLSVAVGRDEIDVTRALLEAGADPDATPERADTPLVIAAARGAEELVALLLGSGVDVDRRGAHEMTALMAAAAQGEGDVVRMLLAAGADAKKRNATDMTAVQLAQQAGASEVVEELARHRSGFLGWLEGGD